MLEEDTNDYEGLLAAGQENARYKRTMAEQQKMADYMRQGAAPAQGQMVSGHYVAPSWTQQLASLGSAVGSGMKSREAEKSGTGLDSSMGSQNALILKALMRNRSAQQPAVFSGMPTEAYDY